MPGSSFSDLEYSVRKKKTRKELFLGEMDEILSWKELLRERLIKNCIPSFCFVCQI